MVAGTAPRSSRQSPTASAWTTAQLGFVEILPKFPSVPFSSSRGCQNILSDPDMAYRNVFYTHSWVLPPQMCCLSSRVSSQILMHFINQWGHFAATQLTRPVVEGPETLVAPPKSQFHLLGFKEEGKVNLESAYFFSVTKSLWRSLTIPENWFLRKFPFPAPWLSCSPFWTNVW